MLFERNLDINVYPKWSDTIHWVLIYFSPYYIIQL